MRNINLKCMPSLNNEEHYRVYCTLRATQINQLNQLVKVVYKFKSADFKAICIATACGTAIKKCDFYDFQPSKNNFE